MAITVVAQTIEGRTLRDIADIRGTLDHILPLGKSDYPMLRYIDPYGDTVFNGMQMPSVIVELQRLFEEVSTQDEREILLRVRDLAIYCRDNPHAFLRFIGD